MIVPNYPFYRAKVNLRKSKWRSMISRLNSQVNSAYLPFVKAQEKCHHFQ